MTSVCGALADLQNLQHTHTHQNCKTAAKQRLHLEGLNSNLDIEVVSRSAIRLCVLNDLCSCRASAASFAFKPPVPSFDLLKPELSSRPQPSFFCLSQVHMHFPSQLCFFQFKPGQFQTRTCSAFCAAISFKALARFSLSILAFAMASNHANFVLGRWRVTGTQLAQRWHNRKLVVA